MIQAPGGNLIKLLTVVIHVFWYSIVFAPGRLSIMFLGKARKLLKSSIFQALHYRVGSWPCPQKLD
jgi:hypothetical protein